MPDHPQIPDEAYRAVFDAFKGQPPAVEVADTVLTAAYPALRDSILAEAFNALLDHGVSNENGRIDRALASLKEGKG